MHSNIAALSSGVPVVALAYSHKTAGIMHEFDLDEFVLELGGFGQEELATAVRLALDRRHDLTQLIRRKAEHARRKALINFDLIELLLEGKESPQ